MPQGWTVVSEPTTSGWTPVHEGPSADESVGHAQLRGFKEGASQGASDLYEGTKEGLSGIAQIARHPIDTLLALGGGLKAGAQAVPDVARNLANSETRGATLKGLTQGAAAGAAGVDQGASFSRGVGQFLGGTVLPMLATGGAAKGVRVLRAGATPALVVETNAGQELLRVKGAKPIPLAESAATSAPETSRIPYRAPDVVQVAKPSPNAGGRLVTEKVPPPVEAAVADALESVRATEPPSSVNLPPQPELPPGYTPRTSAGPTRQAARRAPKTARAPETPASMPAATPEALPASWQAIVDAAAPVTAETAAPTENVAGIITKRTPKPQAVADARRALGARDAARIFDLSPDQVRASAPGPSRRPLKAELAELDRDYLRRINDERGAVDPAVMRTLGLATGGAVAGSLAADDHPLAGGLVGALGGAALANPSAALKTLQEIRMTGMLSGAALPKSAAGNLGAFVTAAAENGSTAPLKEMLRLPTNAANAAKGFMQGAHPGVGPVGKLNVFGRAMGGLDAATTQALQRAGLSEAEAQRLLLNAPGALGSGTLAKAVRTPLGRAIMPFQNIPINTVTEGINSLNELVPNSGASNTRRALTLAAGAAGAGAGKQTKNPLVLGLLAALAGPRAVPFALGAGLSAGPKVIERVGVGIPDASWKDLVDPLRPINKPAFLHVLEQLNGGS